MGKDDPVIRSFKTSDDILAIIDDLQADYPELTDVEMPLWELMINAVEHGNLEITFEEKSDLLKRGIVADEIDARLQREEFKDRVATLELFDKCDEIVIVIVDQGPGFDWKRFLDRKISEVSGYHGRGMLMARDLFKTLSYIGKGNKVVAVLDKNSALPADA